MKKFLPLLAVFPFFLFACQKELQEEPTVPKNATVLNVEEAFPGKTGVVKQGYLLGQPVVYAEIDGEAVFQGDIILAENQMLSSSPNGRTESTGRSFTRYRWPNLIVYYDVDPNLPNQARVTSAINHWQTKTPLIFIRRTNQPNYIKFRPGSGCSSYAGMIGGQQYITLESACDVGSVIHEIGHAVGLWHEQSRTDRNNSIIINWSNIKPGTEHNFQTYVQQGQDGFTLGEFDFKSIMMYHSTAFSSNRLPTITKLDGTTFKSQRSSLSTGDIAGVNYMYPLGYFRPCPGLATDIGIGADGSIYITGRDTVDNNYYVYKWNGSDWDQLNETAVRIAVDPQGIPWVVQASGEIWKGNGSGSFNKLPGLATDIGIGADGSVYIVGKNTSSVTNTKSVNHTVYKWNGSSWNAINRTAIRIAVDPQGIPWIVQANGNIWKGNASGSSSFKKLRGLATDIGIGADGSVYVVGKNTTPATNTTPVDNTTSVTNTTSVDNTIYKWNGSSWNAINEAGVSITVDAEGKPWVVNSKGEIFRPAN